MTSIVAVRLSEPLGSRGLTVPFTGPTMRSDRPDGNHTSLTRDYGGMACERWREMMSAQLDGEDDPADRPLVDEHLAGCGGCREWLDRAATVNRITRTSLVRPVPDLTDSIMAALRPDAVGAVVAAPRVRRRVSTVNLLYLALAVIGAVQLILGLAQVGGAASGAHVHPGLDATPGHLWHESAAWNVAVGAGYLFISLRRNRPTGLVPMLTAFVGMLLLLSVNDLSAGRVDATRLVSHGFVIAGYLLVVALSRRAGTDPGGRSGVRGWRAEFGDGESDGAGGANREPGVPGLRLVPPGPITAHVTERTAA